MLYLIDAELTRAPQAAALLAATVPVFKLVREPLTRIDTPEETLSCSPGRTDAVLFANPPDGVVDRDVAGLLAEAVEAGALMCPVAMDDTCRCPPEAVGANSFDVLDAGRRRGLGSADVRHVAEEFARSVLARLQPTLAADRLRLFLSYRRADGEGLAADLDRELRRLHRGLVFRDLVEIEVGEDPAGRIEAALDVADLVVFLDTFDAGSSPWIARELARATARQIPVLWVRLGPVEREGTKRPELPVSPGGRPAIEESGEPAQVDVPELAATVLRRAFELGREHARAALVSLRTLKEQARVTRRRVEVLDARRHIYRVVEPDSPEPYPRRPRTDIVQFFGRRPSDEDRAQFLDWLEEKRHGPHEDHKCRAYDAAVMLDPRPLAARDAHGEAMVVGASHDYLTFLAPSDDAAGEPAPAGTSPWLLLLGSQHEPGARQHVSACAGEVMRVWLGRGGSVALGLHPSFLLIVDEQARRLLAPGERRIVAFQSDHFPRNPVLEELADRVDVVRTEDRGERDPSLTVMRERMVGAHRYAAVACVGGRTHEGGTHRPGLDEEVALARAQGLPLFLFGAPGGRTRELAEEGQDRRTGLPAEDEERLRHGEDYPALAELVWRRRRTA